MHFCDILMLLHERYPCQIVNTVQYYQNMQYELLPTDQIREIDLKVNCLIKNTACFTENFVRNHPDFTKTCGFCKDFAESHCFTADVGGCVTILAFSRMIEYQTVQILCLLLPGQRHILATVCAMTIIVGLRCASPNITVMRTKFLVLDFPRHIKCIMLDSDIIFLKVMELIKIRSLKCCISIGLILQCNKR